MNTLIRSLIWGIYSIVSLLLCIWLAWHVFAQMNFLYPTWYKVLNINQTVQQTIPRHIYKKEFIDTDPFEHQRLFGEIVAAVQNNGKGLEEIVFYDVNGRPLGKLLTKNEVIHLQDVSNLISNLNWICLVLLVACIMLLAVITFYRLAMPSLNKIIIGIALFIVFTGLTIVIYGPKKFFYWLHTIVFPENHQWFFYYEESLMSTLMKAPELFAPISIQLLLFGAFIWICQLWLLERFNNSQNNNRN